MAAITNCSDFGAPKNKVSLCFHCFPIYLPWSLALRKPPDQAHPWMTTGRKELIYSCQSLTESRALLVPLYYKMSLNSHSWRWFFETLVHNLLGLPAFWIKSLFIAPTIRFLIFYFLCSKQYKFGLSCSFAQLCPSLCDPIDCSMPGFPVHHRLLKFAQTQAHWVGDAIQPSHPLLSPSPAFNLSQHQGLFKWVSSSHQVAKILEIQLQH